MSTRRHKIVLANGCFDQLHYGHLIHLEAAKAMGAFLVVSITKDEKVNKGPGRPVYPEEHRAALVGALKCVDEVIIVDGLLTALTLICPDILVKGIDYAKGLEPVHERFCKDMGIQIRFTDTPKLTARELIDESRRRSGL